MWASTIAFQVVPGEMMTILRRTADRVENLGRMDQLAIASSSGDLVR